MRKKTPRLYLMASIPMRLSVLSDLSGIPESTLKQHISDGDFKAKRDGDRILMVDPADFWEWFDSLPDANNQKPTRRDTRSTAEREDSLSGGGEREARLRLG